jgi:hypothetical protein
VSETPCRYCVGTGRLLLHGGYYRCGACTGSGRDALAAQRRAQVAWLVIAVVVFAIVAVALVWAQH